MKCSLCTYTNSPDNLNSLVAHLEHCEHPEKLNAKVLWRDGELVATLDEPKKDEHIFSVVIPNHEPAPVPPIAEPQPPVESTVKEVLVKDLGDKG